MSEERGPRRRGITVMAPHHSRDAGGIALVEARHPVVLAVDDDRGIRDVLAGTLEGHYDLVLAADGQAAIEAFEEQRFDAVLLDIRMPGMGGLEVLRRMKAIEPRVEIIL